MSKRVLAMMLFVLSSAFLSCKVTEPSPGNSSEIPAVSGLRIAAYDTAKGIVTLAWHPAGFGGLLSYMVFREAENAALLPVTPINTQRIKDTLFYDTLFTGPADTATSAKPVEYRICIQDTLGNLGTKSSAVPFEAPAPQSVRTQIGFRILDGHHDSASINDTLRIIAAFTNPGRNMASAHWSKAGVVFDLRTAGLHGKSGEDTLRFTQSIQGDPKIICDLRDDGGAVWSDTVAVHYIWDKPQAYFLEGTESIAFLTDTIRVHGAAVQEYGRIVKWEWKWGADGIYSQSSDSSIVSPLPDHGSGIYTLYLRVTDDDGLSDSCAYSFLGWNSRIRRDFPKGMSSIVSSTLLDGLIYVLGAARSDVYVYDPTANTLTQLAPRLATREDFGTVAFQGKLWTIGGAGNQIADTTVEIYDPKSNTWQLGPSLKSPRLTHAVLATDKWIFAVGHESGKTKNSPELKVSFATTEFYDPSRGTWSLLPDSLGSPSNVFRYENQNFWFETNSQSYGIRLSALSDSLQPAHQVQEIPVSSAYCLPSALSPIAIDGDILYGFSDQRCSPIFYAFNLKSKVIALVPIPSAINRYASHNDQINHPMIAYEGNLYLIIADIDGTRMMEYIPK